MNDWLFDLGDTICDCDGGELVVEGVDKDEYYFVGRPRIGLSKRIVERNFCLKRKRPLTMEEFKEHFQVVVQVDKNADKLLREHYTIMGVTKYFLPDNCYPSFVYIVSVAYGDCVGRRVPRDDFKLKSNEACEGEWLCKDYGGWWHILTDKEVKECREEDIEGILYGRKKNTDV